VGTIRLLLVGLLALAGVALPGASPAFACSCAGGGVREHLTGSEVVLAATVTDVDDDGFLFLPARERTFELDVDTVWVGEPTTELHSEASGASCGLEGIEEGERYVFFGYRQGREEVRAQLCGGTSRATPRLLTRLERAAGRGSPAPDATSAPASRADEPGTPQAAWLIGLVSVAVGVGAGVWRRRRRTA